MEVVARGSAILAMHRMASCPLFGRLIYETFFSGSATFASTSRDAGNGSCRSETPSESVSDRSFGLSW